MKTGYAPLLMSKFVVGRGSLDFLGTFKDRRVSVIHGGPNVLSDSTRTRLESLFAQNGGTLRFSEPVLREPYLSDVRAISGKIEAYQPDLIVALGGGAVMDTAKVVQMLYENPGIRKEDLLKPYGIPDLGKKATLIAVPTTSGTGSETTSAAVFTDDETRQKCLMLGNGLIPDYAVLDADFTDTLPASIAGYTGIDALTHAMEAAVCTISSPLVKSLAINAAVDLFENLEVSAKSDGNGTNRAQAREKCHVAASLAGVAITNSCTGLAHGLDQPGAHFGVPHGQTCGLFLPLTAAFTGVHPSYVTMARRLGLTGNDQNELCQALFERIRQLTASLGIPEGFKDFGIRERDYMNQVDRFADLAVQAMATKLAPRVPSLDEAKKMLVAAYGGHPSP